MFGDALRKGIAAQSDGAAAAFGGGSALGGSCLQTWLTPTPEKCVWEGGAGTQEVQRHLAAFGQLTCAVFAQKEGRRLNSPADAGLSWG